jgi:predicted 3-demethylubiquinone-9 3-methyltransferase (glyoxalase superfamily)
MQTISPFIWFDNSAEEAAKLYVSIFPNSQISGINRYDEFGAKASGMTAGSAMTVSFMLDGQEFTALNGGPLFKFTEAVSFVVKCKTQTEIDRYWNSLIANGGQEDQCGWLKDKFGLSWQIVPEKLGELLGGNDAAKSGRAMQAMLKMHKLDIKVLELA